MWFLEILESALLAVPWALAAILTVAIAMPVCAVIAWLAMYVWVDVLGRDVSWDPEPACAWDPDDVAEVTDGHAT